jgi:hypothetical protein
MTSLAAANGGALDDRGVRAIVNEFSVAKAEGPHQDFIRKLATRWHEFNERHFEGRLSPAYLAVSEPRSPRADGDCSLFSGHGGRLQIRIRPSHVAGTVNQGKVPAPGKTVRFMRPDHGLEYRERHLVDILLHEMGHQFEMEVLGTGGGHGKVFCAICNRIGAELGLPPVVIRRRKGDPKSLPICAQWPHNVRPKNYYGDLWGEITGPAEEGEDLVERILALIGTLDEPDQLRLGADSMVADIVSKATASGGKPEPEPEPEAEGDQRLRAAMEADGWSQTTLAKAAGVGQATISRLINGKPGISDATINRVMEVLGL